MVKLLMLAWRVLVGGCAVTIILFLCSKHVVRQIIVDYS